MVLTFLGKKNEDVYSGDLNHLFVLLSESLQYLVVKVHKSISILLNRLIFILLVFSRKNIKVCEKKLLLIQISLLKIYVGPCGEGKTTLLQFTSLRAVSW
jgi:hypothetical protein